MGYQSSTGESLANDGNYLNSEGWYHFFVTDCDDPAVKQDGSLWSGKILTLHNEVISGTVPGQEKKTKSITVNEPSPSNSDGGAFAQKVCERLAIALGLVSGPKQNYSLEKSTVMIPKSTGQFVAYMHFPIDKRTEKPSKYLDVDGLKIYHVDDPVVAAVVANPASQKAIKLIPPSLRRSAKPANGTQPANANGNGASQPQQPVGAGAGSANGIDTSNL